ncbi:protein kinase domain protein [Cordyceps militaris CM01]|uniref:non-specific serine/threonine protein kinase n=1 Tax=Cordyceps militaris (strain CM01) TaxID=983644 RepID=G3JL10_CORMM|nr:protein kinase domain protein [Cordyceps militaris CM01]EGX90384.1 protein kinase domain protein [Cordyceps militaris CM01]
MGPLLKWASGLLSRAPLLPLQFPATGFKVITDATLLEEQHYDEFKTGNYCPVNIGDVYDSNTYQVLGKLGFGSTATVWLARNLRNRRFYALKVFMRNHDDACMSELRTYNAIADANPFHPGHRHVRTGVHIKADNILHAIVDEGILESFVKDEMETPSPRKYVNTAPIYMSRRFGLPEDFGIIVLSDFGEVVNGDVERNHNAQPDVYRSPEVMLQAAWSYPIDIWNVGAMIWDVFEGGHLFHGLDPSPEKGYYTTRAHLAEIIALLGPPPLDLLQRGTRSEEFFSEDGQWIADCPIPQGKSLEKAELFLTGRNKEMFLSFVKGMLTWRPEERKTAKELLEDPWLKTWDIND